VITNNNPLHTRFDSELRILNMLDPLQHNRAIPFLLEQFNLVPGMGSAGEDILLPVLAGKADVLFDFLTVLFLELAPEDGVGEANLVADAFGEGDVGVVEVGGAPGEGPGVEGNDEDFVAGCFGTVEEGGGDFVVLKSGRWLERHY